MDALESPWKPERYHDDYEEELRKRIKAKQKGKLETVEEEKPPAKVLDLMDALQASLDRGARGARSAAKPKKSRTGSPSSRSRTTKRTAGRRTTKRSARRAG